jgi:hypothetical protein
MSKRAIRINCLFKKCLPVILEEDEAHYYALQEKVLARQEEKLLHDTEAYVLQVDHWRATHKDSAPLHHKLVLQGAALLLRAHELREEYAMLQSL